MVAFSTDGLIDNDWQWCRRTISEGLLSVMKPLVAVLYDGTVPHYGVELLWAFHGDA